MKKILIFLSLFSLVACQKDLNLPQNTEGVYNDEIEEIDDSEPFNAESEPVEIEDRAAKPLVITALEAANESDLAPDYVCFRESFQKALPLSEGTHSFVRIKGYGFGNVADTNAIKVKIRGIETPLFWSSGINDTYWKDTSVVIYIKELGLYTRNNTLKFEMTRTINGKTYKASKSKMSIGKINWWAERNGIMDIALPSSHVWFGTSLWEVAQQRRMMHIDTISQQQDEKYKFKTIKAAINQSYTPQYGDALRVDDRFGFVRSVSSAADRNGYLTVEVYERNIRCTGTRQKKKYKFKNGAFVQRPNETTVWTHYYR